MPARTSVSYQSKDNQIASSLPSSHPRGFRSRIASGGNTSSSGFNFRQSLGSGFEGMTRADSDSASGFSRHTTAFTHQSTVGDEESEVGVAPNEQALASGISRISAESSDKGAFTPMSFTQSAAAIRASTARLADLAGQDHNESASDLRQSRRRESVSSGSNRNRSRSAGRARGLSMSSNGTEGMSSIGAVAQAPTPQAVPVSVASTLPVVKSSPSPPFKASGSPSGLTLMMQNNNGQNLSSSSSAKSIADNATEVQETSKVSGEFEDHGIPDIVIQSYGSQTHLYTASPKYTSSKRSLPINDTNDNQRSDADERTPLIPTPLHPTEPKSLVSRLRLPAYKSFSIPKRPSLATVIEEAVTKPVKILPAVLLGLLLNVLDGVSYGMITFPTTLVFNDFGSIGVSMFFMSCIVSQLVFTCGGSIFVAGNGSMMIEAVPFFHVIVQTITNRVGEENPQSVVATTMVAMAFSSMLTGLVFFILGHWKLGKLVGFFPRHILVGAIGGVGVFLVKTGLEVSAGLEGEGITLTMDCLHSFFGSIEAVLLWTIPFCLALALKFFQHFFKHELLFPGYFVSIAIIFYIVVFSARLQWQSLRDRGWVFDVGATAEPWYTFYTLYDFRQTHWGAFVDALPTQCALVFFGILHVPLNVPALGLSLKEDNVDLDRELVAHGGSNFLAGVFGTVPNYLCYVNSVLFYRLGGNTRLAGLMLTVATAGIMFAGPNLIGFLPVCLVGALIFVLGFELCIEALWDTKSQVNRFEYFTIWVIVFGMTYFDFVVGLFLGIVLACVFFVVQSSRRKAIRAAFSGASTTSTVRRPYQQKAFIQDVGSQTQIIKLQGFLFFGTINSVENDIRTLLDDAAWKQNPIRFLILDLWLVYGLDYSAAEAFVRIHRLLEEKKVLLILCGSHPDKPVGQALQRVGLWKDREDKRVEVLKDLNEALEWTENAYLNSFYIGRHPPPEPTPEDPAILTAYALPFKPQFSLGDAFENSPRRNHLVKAGDATIIEQPTSQSPPPPSERLAQSPLSSSVSAAAVNGSFETASLSILLKTFSAYTDLKSEFFVNICPYLEMCHVDAGDVLWNQGDEADGLYVIEHGVLKATYAFDMYEREVEETMVAGVVAGELSFLSRSTRNARVTVESTATLWKMDTGSFQNLAKDLPYIHREWVTILLRVASEEQEVLSSHMVAVLS